MLGTLWDRVCAGFCGDSRRGASEAKHVLGLQNTELESGPALLSHLLVETLCVQGERSTIHTVRIAPGLHGSGRVIYGDLVKLTRHILSIV